MFILHMFSAVIAGVCKILLIIAVGCYLLTAVSAGASDNAPIGHQQYASDQSTFSSRSYKMASEFAGDIWDELSQYRVQIVKVDK